MHTLGDRVATQHLVEPRPAPRKNSPIAPGRPYVRTRAPIAREIRRSKLASAAEKYSLSQVQNLACITKLWRMEGKGTEILQISPQSIGICTPLDDSKQISRKLKQPQKTPVRCSNCAVVKFQLIDGTPVPSLDIRTTGSHWYLKARRRLFSQSDAKCSGAKEKVLECHAECTLSTVSTTRVCAPQNHEEVEMHESSLSEKKQNSVYKGKVCASCKTRKTPLWRDSEDGTPYCNACGIRFKKYRICCPICSYIPRKDEKLGNICCHCGSSLFQYNRI